jgi:hypothetical protein
MNKFLKNTLLIFSLLILFVVIVVIVKITSPTKDKIIQKKDITQSNVVKGEIQIILVEHRERIGKGSFKQKYRWYTYYVQNYYDSDEIDNEMKRICDKLPFDIHGYTEVFFFNDRENIPKLAKDGGWDSNESQNSWNAKYGKYCVGYFLIGAGYENGEFSKKWE